MKNSNLIIAAFCSLFASCAAIQGPASVDSSATVASSYIFRGVPQTAKPALWTDMAASVNDEQGGSYSGAVWGNMNLSNDSGDAVFPDGHGLKFTEVDIIAGYSRDVSDVGLAITLINYNFPNVGGASTTEVVLGASTVMSGLDAAFDLYIDVEEVKGLYANGSVGRSFNVGENLTADLGLSLGYMDSDQGLAYIGSETSGLSDLVGSAGLNYGLNQNTSITLALSASSVLDGDYEDTLDASGIDSNNVWVTLGVSKSF